MIVRYIYIFIIDFVTDTISYFCMEKLYGEGDCSIIVKKEKRNNRSSLFILQFVKTKERTRGNE